MIYKKGGGEWLLKRGGKFFGEKKQCFLCGLAPGVTYQIHDCLPGNSKYDLHLARKVTTHCFIPFMVLVFAILNK